MKFLTIHLTMIVLIFTITGCGTSAEMKDDEKTTTTVGADTKKNATGEPSWVVKLPNDSKYYIGIGNGNSLEAAQASALNMIVSQIKIKIQSEINDYIKETNGVTEEQTSQMIKINLKANIEDVELVDTWKSPDRGYYAYQRLNIAKYQLKQQQKMENAKKIALDYLSKSDSEQDDALALKYAMLGYYNVGKYMSTAMKAEYKGKEVYLVNELTARIQEILSRTSLSVNKTEVSIAKLSPKPVEVLFTIKSNKGPFVNLPIAFIMNKGKLDLSKGGSTNSSGTVRCMINKALGKEPVQTFSAVPDLLTYIENATEDEEEKMLFYSNLVQLGLPEAEVVVNVQLPDIQYQLFLENDTNADPKYKTKFDGLSNSIKNALIKEAQAKFSDKGELKMLVTFDGFLKQSDNSGIWYMRLSSNISIVNVKTNEEVFSTSTKEIKGGGDREDKAIQKAIDDYKKDHINNVVKQIVEYLNGI